MIRFQTYLALLLVTLWISGCSSSTQTAPEARTTTIIGKAFFRDTLYSFAPGSGVKVEVEGRAASAISDSNGIWTIPNLLSGYYNMRFSKPGYTEARLYQVAVVGGDTLYLNADIELWPVVHHVISLDSFTVNKVFIGDSAYVITFTVISIDGKVQTNYDQQNYSYFVSRTPNPTVLDSNSYFSGQWLGTEYQKIQLPTSQLNLHAGDVLYIVGYATKYYPHPSYNVGLNTVWRWQDLGSPSNVVKVTLP